MKTFPWPLSFQPEALLIKFWLVREKVGTAADRVNHFAR